MAKNTVEWCDSCNRLVSDEAVQIDRDGTHRCPLCRHVLRMPTEDQAAIADLTEERARAPWHFKFLLLATAGYLVYRVIWIIQRLTHHG